MNVYLLCFRLYFKRRDMIAYFALIAAMFTSAINRLICMIYSALYTCPCMHVVDINSTELYICMHGDPENTSTGVDSVEDDYTIRGVHPRGDDARSCMRHCNFRGEKVPRDSVQCRPVMHGPRSRFTRLRHDSL